MSGERNGEKSSARESGEHVRARGEPRVALGGAADEATEETQLEFTGWEKTQDEWRPETEVRQPSVAQKVHEKAASQEVIDDAARTLGAHPRPRRWTGPAAR